MKNKLTFPLVIVGAQWGDEGKGKIVDVLAKEADIIIRFNGGNNAGHTVVVHGEKFKLSLLPSGVLHKKRLFLSQGVVIDPQVLLEEITFFEKRKLPVDLVIDPRVHVVMPYHKALDAATEAWKGKKATGSLKLGIGYCYEDKNNRFGIRVEDLIDPKRLKEKLDTYLPLKILQITKVFGQKNTLKKEEIYKQYAAYGKRLKKYVGDVSLLTQIGLNKKKKILFEGAHGTLLDSVFGTYPYTVAIQTISGSIFPYVGVAPQSVDSLGIVKAYTTRVGNGPFPTELFDKTGEKIREIGREFGSVSKRPRRCGWLDIPMLRTAARLSGFTLLAITKIDVLSSLPEIKICIGYQLGTKLLQELPAEMNDFLKCKPVYKTFKGWEKPLDGITKFSDLPKEAKAYIKVIADALQVPVNIISLSPDRNGTIFV